MYQWQYITSDYIKGVTTAIIWLNILPLLEGLDKAKRRETMNGVDLFIRKVRLELNHAADHMQYPH